MGEEARPAAVLTGESGLDKIIEWVHNAKRNRQRRRSSKGEVSLSVFMCFYVSEQDAVYTA